MESCKRHHGKVGIITGAASGIGRSTAQRLAREGAALVLVDLFETELRELAQEISASDAPSPLPLVIDITQESEVGRMVASALETFNRIDFLVTSAGILRRTRFAELEPSEWDQVMAVNLRGPYLCCRAVVPAMISQGGGVIVNVASLAGRSCSVLGGAHYTASKHGVIGLSRHLARELGSHAIRVNTFCPGGTLTPMVEKNTPSEERSAYAAGWPLKRWADPEEQASVISFLISDDSSFITGASIDSNGGALML